MAIIQTVNFNQFFEAFNGMGRGEQFTYEALKNLHDYYEQLSDDLGEPIELDVIAICLEWSEYTLEEYNEEFGQEFEDLAAVTDELDDSGTRYLVVDDKSILVENC